MSDASVRVAGFGASALVKFNTALARARLTRGRTVYATGTSATLSNARTKLMLTDRRPLRPGNYTLTIRTRLGHDWRTRRQTMTIG